MLLFFRIFGLSLTFGRGHRRLLVGPEGFGFLGVILGFGFVDAMKCFFALLAIPRRKVGGVLIVERLGGVGCSGLLPDVGCAGLPSVGCTGLLSSVGCPGV